MAAAMPGEKRHFPALQPPNHVWFRGLPERRSEANLFLRLESWHGIQATAAYNTDFRFDGQSLTGSF
jgi:hypothetical protein